MPRNQTKLISSDNQQFIWSEDIYIWAISEISHKPCQGFLWYQIKSIEARELKLMFITMQKKQRGNKKMKEKMEKTKKKVKRATKITIFTMPF